jgi:methylphosphotriester-DNA--protein-cysteine methyltransferase
MLKDINERFTDKYKDIDLPLPKLKMKQLLLELSITRREFYIVTDKQEKFDDMYKGALMEKAEEVLQLGLYDVNQAQLMSGYSQSTPFRDTFTKYRGVKPSKVKNILVPNLA